MDPISALGLAAAVCQFVDFGTKIIHTIYSIHQSANGATQENGDLAKLTTTLRDLQTRLAAPQMPSKSEGMAPTRKLWKGLQPDAKKSQTTCSSYWRTSEWRSQQRVCGALVRA
jgi:hypothetical protein